MKIVKKIAFFFIIISFVVSMIVIFDAVLMIVIHADFSVFYDYIKSADFTSTRYDWIYR